MRRRERLPKPEGKGGFDSTPEAVPSNLHNHWAIRVSSLSSLARPCPPTLIGTALVAPLQPRRPPPSLCDRLSDIPPSRPPPYALRSSPSLYLPSTLRPLSSAIPPPSALHCPFTLRPRLPSASSALRLPSTLCLLPSLYPPPSLHALRSPLSLYLPSTLRRLSSAFPPPSALHLPSAPPALRLPSSLHPPPFTFPPRPPPSTFPLPSAPRPPPSLLGLICMLIRAVARGRRLLLASTAPSDDALRQEGIPRGEIVAAPSPSGYS